MSLLTAPTLTSQGVGSGSGYGLAIGKGGCTVPIGGLGNLIGNSLSNVFGTADTNGSSTYRTFHPLTDPKAGAVLPVWTNNPNPSSVSGDNAAPNAITIAAAVELSDGTVVPFTFAGGQHTITIPAAGGFLAIPDAPIAIGAQATDATWGSGVIIRTYVTVPLATRTDTVGITSGSATVTDASITAQDQGRLIKGTGIPANAYIGTVTASTSFLLSSRPDSQVNVTATATNASLSATILSVWPLNYGLPTTANSLYRYNGQNGADLTLEGSTGGAAAAFTTNTSCYGPALILGPAPSGRKPIVLCMSDSIFASVLDQSVGPVARTAAQLKLPFVRMSKVSETALGVSTPVGRKYRAAAIPGCTHAIIEYGTNDGLDTTPKIALNQGYTTALVNYLTSLGIKVWAATIPPKTSSTDGFATLAGQTALNLPANLAAYNTWLRGLPLGLSGVIDLHDLVASGRDTGLWTVGANSRRVTDMATTNASGAITSATANFTSTDVGTGIYVAGAQTNTNAVISSVQSTTAATMSINASATVSGAVAGIGAYYSTIDGLHPSLAFYQGALTTAVQNVMATWTL